MVDLDTYRAAKLIIEQHGDGAADYALKRAGQLFDRGAANQAGL